MSKINVTANALAALLLTSAAHAQQTYPGGVRVGVWQPAEFLYTPADVRGMRERLAEEPADGPLHHKVNQGRGWLGRLAKPGYLERLLPEGVPIHGGYPVGKCPACAKAAPRWQGRCGGHLACPECKTVFPNDKFPDTETMDLGGRVYRYALDADGNPSNRSGSARYWQVNWTMKHDRPHQFLAIAYLLTGDRRFARAAAQGRSLLEGSQNPRSRERGPD